MRLLSIVVAVIALTGCAREAAAPSAAPAVVPVAVAAAPGAAELTGRVLETMEAPGYTYLRLSTSGGPQWAAIPSETIAVGTEVKLANPTLMKNFVSKTLNRTFEVIVFASGAEKLEGGAAEAAVKAPASGTEYAALNDWAKKAAPAPAEAPIAKATGAQARTVAEVYAQKAALLDVPVLLRGKVVKYTPGVMGKNWLHLQDGSGTAEGKDNDLVVTTTDLAALGDTVVVNGPVHLGRDLGSGYVFPVLIEDAKIIR